MYGLGIGLAFYIQWIGVTAVEYIDESQLAPVRLLGLALSASTFIGLLCQGPAGHLSLAEVYLVLLLAMGIYLFTVPVYLWKAVTRFNPYWDPFRCTDEEQSPIYRIMDFSLMLALSCVGVWFWCAFVTDREADCDTYGFFFSRVAIENKVFKAFNALVYLVILLASIGVLLLRAGRELDIFKKKKKKPRRIR